MAKAYRPSFLVVGALSLLLAGGCDDGLTSPDDVTQPSAEQAEASKPDAPALSKPAQPLAANTDPCDGYITPPGGPLLGALTKAECEQIKEQILQVMENPNRGCYNIGQSAMMRLGRGEFQQGYDKDPRVLAYVIFERDDTTGETYMTQPGLDPDTDLSNTIAHEEVHHFGYRHGQEYQGHTPYEWGFRCGGI